MNVILVQHLNHYLRGCLNIDRMKNEVKNHRPLYNHMIDNGIDNFYIELVENYPCESVEELRKREGELIREYGTLNKAVAGRGRQAVLKAYRDTHKEQAKEYHEKNKEKHNERSKDYRDKNTEKLKNCKNNIMKQTKKKF